MNPKHQETLVLTATMLNENGEEFHSELLYAIRRFNEARKMKRCWDLVAPKDHWKAEIDKIVSCEEDIDGISEAIVHYTATLATIHDLENGTVRITAPGYWGGPCN